MKRSFSELNPVRVGFVGILVILGVVVLTFNVTSVPFVSGTVYRAMFTEIGSLERGDKVRMSGIEVGDVSDLEVDGDRVIVSFRIEPDVRLGQKTRAQIKTATVLGSKYLEIVPSGPGRIAGGEAIPLQRTTPPYQLNDVLGQLAGEVKEIDVAKVSEALATFAATFEGTAPAASATLRGLTRISKTVNKRDEALQTLLHTAEDVTDVLRHRSGEITKLIVDANLVLAELQRRRAAIDQLMTNVQRAARQITGLVEDNRKQLEPTLEQLNEVLDVLNKNKDDISKALELVTPFANALGDAVASGPFFHATVANLIAPTNLVPVSKGGLGFAGPSASSGGSPSGQIQLLEQLERMRGGL